MGGLLLTMLNVCGLTGEKGIKKALNFFEACVGAEGFEPPPSRLKGGMP